MSLKENKIIHLFAFLCFSESRFSTLTEIKLQKGERLLSINDPKRVFNRLFCLDLVTFTLKNKLIL